MLIGEQIPELVDLLTKRETCLYHACQYQDFLAYLDMGGIPSRHCLENSGRTFTAFQTDAIDHENGVWDKVFVNLSDFGFYFAKGSGVTPNPYGPILLHVRPRALLEASDIAVCLRSAGAEDFNRNKESLVSVEEVNRLFAYPSEIGTPKSTYIKFSEQLKEDFKFPKAKSPEISCTYPDGFIPFDHVIYLTVDPYEFNGQSLKQIVDSRLKQSGKKNGSGVRKCKDRNRVPIYQELARLLVGEIPSFDQLSNDDRVSQDLKEWINQTRKNDIEWQYQRYARYLRDGTIQPILGDNG